MDGFTAFICWTVLVAGIAFGVGRLYPLQEISFDIANTGKTVIKGTTYQCKPISVTVGGKVFEVNE